MEEKYIACMLLHAVGDTVGYKNGDWEFRKGLEQSLEKLYEFIDLGGVNQISLKDWNVSDDTIMHIQTAVSLLSNFKNINMLATTMSLNFIDAFDQFIQEGLEIRNPGIATLKSLKLLKENISWNNIPYNIKNGGAGASMRSLCIGLAFYGEENRHKLIQIAIETSRITNNSAVGYLGGLASALFTALAIEGKDIKDWPFILLNLFDSGTIMKYIKSAGRDVEEFERDYHIFLEKWYRYIGDKFNEKREPIKRKSFVNLFYRSKYYFDNFSLKIKINDNDTPEDVNNNEYYVSAAYQYIGSGGDDSVIIAYDSLIDCNNNWEKLVTYSMLHAGDTDTTGAIAGGLYGIVYGLDNVPENFTQYLEYKKELIDISKKLYKKYYKTQKN